MIYFSPDKLSGLKTFIYSTSFSLTGSPANRKEESSPGLRQKPIKKKPGDVSCVLIIKLIIFWKFWVFHRFSEIQVFGENVDFELLN